MADDNNQNNNSEPIEFPNFSKLEKVQDLLDNNRHLLQQIKANHDEQRPEGLAKNFTLIQDVNANIDKVLQVYVQISEDYRAFMKQRPEEAGNDVNRSDDADQPAT